MFRTINAIILTLAMLCGFASFDYVSAEAATSESQAFTDLYRVQIRNRADAETLSYCGVEVLINSADGYLVLADVEGVKRLAKSVLPHTLVAAEVGRSDLALCTSDGKELTDRFPPIYKDSTICLCRVNRDILRVLGPDAGLIPLPAASPRVLTGQGSGKIIPMTSKRLDLDLEELISQVSVDSIVSYSEALQTMGNRPSGSARNSACAEWIFNKFLEFGCDSVAFDPFIADGWWEDGIEGKNVLAYKFGSLYEHDRIIVCAHFDGVQGSPAADDNGSGVAAVLEMARILKDIETNLTIIFALWDAEEDGDVGSHYYADRAFDEGERIALVLNQDMIGFWKNDYSAYVFHSISHDFAALWAQMADSLPGIDITANITTSMYYNSAYSDHRSFVELG